MRNNPAFSIVITTYNRVSLVRRAIRSALGQQFKNPEVIVVDDASTDGTAEYIQKEFPEIRYLRQETNRGAGAGRNWGIREATNPWVVILDDDDELLSSALKDIAHQIILSDNANSFPVLQFAHSNGSIPEPYLLIRIEHYLRGILKGDFIPVINRNVFIERGFAYSETLSVGEHLLWWRIAQLYGIPTWSKQVAVIHDDAPIRLTSPVNQIKRAKAYAELQELTLKEFGELLEAQYPSIYQTKCLGAATYWLLAGNRLRAREYASTMLRDKPSVKPAILWVLSFMPYYLIRRTFLAYRQLARGV